MRTPAILHPLIGRFPGFHRLNHVLCIGSGTREQVEKALQGLRRIKSDLRIRLVAQPECGDLDVDEWIDIRQAEASPWRHLRELKASRPDAVAWIMNGRTVFWRQWLFASAIPCRYSMAYNEHGDGFFLRLGSLSHLYRILFGRARGGGGRVGPGLAERMTRLVGIPYLCLEASWLQWRRCHVAPAFAVPGPGLFDWRETIVQHQLFSSEDAKTREAVERRTASGTAPQRSVETEAPIEFTGERFVPGSDPSLELEHVSRYSFASRFAPGRRALDAGCGEGYGVASLADAAAQAVGVDVSEEAIRKARARYARENLEFVQVEVGETYPFDDGSFGIVTSFEVIEHIADWRSYVAELARVLADDGVLVISTPNRPYYRDERGEINEYHIKEFDRAEFDALLAVHFPYRRLYGQNHSAGILIEDFRSDRVEVDAKDSLSGRELDSSHFFIAVCSRQPLPEVEGLCYPTMRGNQLRDRERQIAILKRELESARAAYERLEREYEERGHWALSLLSKVEELKTELEETDGPRRDQGK